MQGSPFSNVGRVRGTLSLAVLLTFVVLIWASFSLSLSHNRLLEAQATTVRGEHLRGLIMQYDEVLTMSARMASVTGDPRWEKRYLHYEPLLSVAIQEAQGLFPGAEVALQTDEANHRLVELETQAFEAARAGRLQDAQACFGEEYEKQKGIYSKGMVKFSQALNESGDLLVKKEQDFHDSLLGAFAVLSLLLTAVWAYVVRKVRHWQTTLLERNRELDSSAAELRKANETLRDFQDQLVQSQRLKTVGTLAGGVAHNFNNQLQPILAYVDLLLLEGRSDDREALEAIKQSAANCSDLVTRLISFARPSSHSRKSLDFRELLTETTTMLEKTFPSAMEIRLNVATDLHWVESNESELQSVLLNLATNAKDAMEGKGRLSLQARNLDENRILFTMTDTGCGMTAETQQRIFDPFFTTKGPHEGTGLGLSSVFSIITDLGGSVEVKSTPGQGTTFQIVLPGSAGVRAEAEPAVSAESPDTDSNAILFVDDEYPIRKVASRMFERYGYSVDLASDGFEALKLYDPARHLAVVTDVTMPRMSGTELSRKIKNKNPEAIIILASGNIDLSAADGVSATMQKPYDLKALVRLVESLLGERKEEQERRLMDSLSEVVKGLDKN